MQNAWVSDITQVKFYQGQDQLSMNQGCLTIYFNFGILDPKCCKPTLLNKLHHTHPKDDIEDNIKSCIDCV